MIICWGQKFANAQELFEHPRCYVSTIHILRKRLRDLPPEVAVVPEFFELSGKRYSTIYQLHHQACGNIAISTLYKRLGMIVNNHKVTPEQATCPQIWSRLIKLKRTGTYGTVIEMHN
jgi:hypothetical protein